MHIWQYLMSTASAVVKEKTIFSLFHLHGSTFSPLVSMIWGVPFRVWRLESDPHHDDSAKQSNLGGNLDQANHHLLRRDQHSIYAGCTWTQISRTESWSGSGFWCVNGRSFCNFKFSILVMPKSQFLFHIPYFLYSCEVIS